MRLFRLKTCSILIIQLPGNNPCDWAVNPFVVGSNTSWRESWHKESNECAVMERLVIRSCVANVKEDEAWSFASCHYRERKWLTEFLNTIVISSTDAPVCQISDLLSFIHISCRLLVVPHEIRRLYSYVSALLCSSVMYTAWSKQHRYVIADLLMTDSVRARVTTVGFKSKAGWV